MASMAAFVYFWSSAYDVSGCCTTDTLYPSFLRIVATGSQPEPSANAPCTRTTFLICCVMTVLLFSRDPLGSWFRHRAPSPARFYVRRNWFLLQSDMVRCTSSRWRSLQVLLLLA